MAPPWLSEGSGSEAILLHGTSHKPAGIVDTGLVYGDYFLQEALVRLRRVAPIGPALPVVAATASTHDGNVPANAVDGNLATRWWASGDGQWLRLDLGTSRPVTKITVAPGRRASGEVRSADLVRRLDVDDAGVRRHERHHARG